MGKYVRSIEQLAVTVSLHITHQTLTGRPNKFGEIYAMKIHSPDGSTYTGYTMYT